MFQFNNLEHELGLKAITWVPERNRFESMADNDFIWEEDGLVNTGCRTFKTVKWLGGIVAEHNMERCFCGIYATFRKGILMSYQGMDARRPVILIEASGKTILYEDGFRAEQAAVRAIVQFGAPMPVLWQARDYFKVPIIELSMALSAMDIWNWFLNTWYKPEDPVILDTGRDNIIDMVSRYLGKSSMEARWQVAP
jgi:hypothetical protein